MTTYNPVRKLSFMDKVRDFYWSNRALCDAAMFLGTVALAVGMLVAAA
jgi:hypothetical protein